MAEQLAGRRRGGTELAASRACHASPVIKTRVWFLGASPWTTPYLERQAPPPVRWLGGRQARRLGGNVPETLFKDTRYDLSKLIGDIEAGELGLPDIQRPFVWARSKVRDLLDSMYQGFPVGYLLLWNAIPDSTARTIGGDDKQSVPSRLIVDGQQRLTSLYAVMTGTAVLTQDFKQEKIRIAFRPRDGYFSVADATTEKDPEFLPDVTKVWKSPEHKVATAFIKGLNDSKPVDEDTEDALRSSISRLVQLRDYPFLAVELGGDADEEQVAEIFVRINSGGTPLNEADFILTLMSVFREKDRRRLEEFARDSRLISPGPASPFNHLISPAPDQLLRVAALVGFQRGRLKSVTSMLRGRSADSGAVLSPAARDKQFDELSAAIDQVLDLGSWHEFLKVPLRAGYRRSTEISSANTLLLCYAIYLLGRNRFHVDAPVLRSAMARYFFMASLTGRYTGSFETAVTRDVQQLAAAKDAQQFVDRLHDMVNTVLTSDFWAITLPSRLGTSSARSPELFAYSAALSLLGAKVLFSELKVSELFDPAVKSTKAPVERHHLFPRAYLIKSGVTDNRDINQIANMAYLEWSDNIRVSDEAPAVYWPKYADRATQQDRQFHALPDGWEQMEYQAFLEARRKLMAGVVRQGFEQLSAVAVAAVPGG